MEFLGDAWSTVIIRPMINSLLLLYWVFFSNFGIAIVAFTMLVRLLMVPLTIKQSRQIKAMNNLQPMMKALQEKFKNDKQRISQETMKMYREHGVNPLGCLGPMFIQFPIWIGLFQAIRQTVPNNPETLVELSGNLYSWLPQVHSIIPINSSFLWMDLANPDPSPFIMPVLVGASMFVMQKMTTMPSVDDRQASTNRMMLWMMPLMFGFFTLNFSSGLAVYWVVSNIIGVAIQGFITGWDPLKNLFAFGRKPELATDTSVATSAIVSSVEETAEDARDIDNGQDGGRGNRARPKRTRRRQGRGRNRRR